MSHITNYEQQQYFSCRYAPSFKDTKQNGIFMQLNNIRGCLEAVVSSLFTIHIIIGEKQIK